MQRKQLKIPRRKLATNNRLRRYHLPVSPSNLKIELLTKAYSVNIPKVHCANTCHSANVWVRVRVKGNSRLSK